MRANSQGEVRVAAIGRLARIKRFDMLIRELSYSASLVDARIVLTMYGDGPEKDRLKTIATRHKSACFEVRFRGHVAQRELLQEASGTYFMAISSEWEGFPKTIGEMLALGIPIISTDVGSIPEFLLEHSVGLVCGGGEREFAHKAAELIQAPSLRATLSENAKAVAPMLARETQCRALIDHMFGKNAIETASA